MELNHYSDRRRPRGTVFAWNQKFKTRNRKQYSSERNKIEVQPPESIVTAFLKELRSGLDPPQYQFTALRAFLEKANETNLLQNLSASQYPLKVALVDDRCDRTGWQDLNGEHHSARNWDLYAPRPPPGDCQHVDLLNAGELLERCKTNRETCGAERRTIYIADMTPLCGLAIVASAPRLQAPVLRDFLERYLSYRGFVGVSMPFLGFAMEFHLPYYALRQYETPRRDTRGLRRCGKFATSHRNSIITEYIYEAQVSVLITGIDEWFWTAYCCTDTYFDGEDTMQSYHESGLDALIGGKERPSWFPVWNPREYFLLILSRRFRQVTKEWSVVVRTLEDRLQIHEASIFKEAPNQPLLIDDINLNRTREYTWTTELLRLLHNALTKSTESWERFKDGELQYFQDEAQEILRVTWDSHLASIEKDLNELQSLRRVLQQKIEIFDNMRHSLVNASAMVESRYATEQGKNIGLLTRVTVLYLPLSLGTAIFSMVILPRTASWISYALVLICLTAITMAIAFQPRRVKDKGMLAWKDIRDTLQALLR